MNPPDDLLGELARLGAADEAALILAYRLCNARRKALLRFLANRFAGAPQDENEKLEADVIPLRKKACE